MAKSSRKNPPIETPGTRLSVVSLFSGIGGFEVGFQRAGHATSLMCEIEPAAQAVLRARFPKQELVSDVRDIAVLPSGTDLLCGGFPCQDLSSSGPKGGIDGSRSSLVSHVFRLLRDDPVEWVVLENVKFMLHLNRGAAMASILDALEALGYRWCYRVVNSLSFGLPHRRHRVFFVASRNHDPRTVLFADDVSERPWAFDPDPSSRPMGFYWTEGTYAVGAADDAVPPLKGGSTIGIPSPPAILFPDGHVGTPDVRDAERLQGFDADWTKPAEAVVRPSARWKLVGNAVTVDVAEWIGHRLAKPGIYRADRDVPLTNWRWPPAAWSMGEGRFAAAVSEWPVTRPRQPLNEFLRYPTKPLSRKATDGFLRRARAGRLSFPAGFLEALDMHGNAQQDQSCRRSSSPPRTCVAG